MSAYRCQCPHCGATVLYRFLGPGEEGACPECGLGFQVPEGGEWTDEEPTHPQGKAPLAGAGQRRGASPPAPESWLPRVWSRLARHLHRPLVVPALTVNLLAVGASVVSAYRPLTWGEAPSYGVQAAGGLGAGVFLIVGTTYLLGVAGVSLTWAWALANLAGGGRPALESVASRWLSAFPGILLLDLLLSIGAMALAWPLFFLLVLSVFFFPVAILAFFALLFASQGFKLFVLALYLDRRLPWGESLAGGWRMYRASWPEVFWVAATLGAAGVVVGFGLPTAAWPLFLLTTVAVATLVGLLSPTYYLLRLEEMGAAAPGVPGIWSAQAGQGGEKAPVAAAGDGKGG